MADPLYPKRMLSQVREIRIADAPHDKHVSLRVGDCANIVYKMHTYRQAFMHANIRTYAHTHTHTHIQTYRHACRHALRHAFIRIYIHACRHTYWAHTYTFMHACMHTFWAHTYTHTHTHTHTHIRMHKIWLPANLQRRLNKMHVEGFDGRYALFAASAITDP